MIKVNLAARKQSVVTSDKPMVADGSPLSKISSPLRIPSFQSEGGGGGIVRRVVIPIVVAVVVTFLVSGFEDDELKDADTQITDLTAKKVKIETESSKMKTYQEWKKVLEADEATIKTKLDIIKKLVVDRARAQKTLVALSTAIPREVWLTEFTVKNSDVVFRGSSLDFGQVSDFIKGLGESAYFTDVNLRSSQQQKDQGLEVANFELTAKQK